MIWYKDVVGRQKPDLAFRRHDGPVTLKGERCMSNVKVKLGGARPVDLNLKGERVQLELKLPGTPQALSAAPAQIQIQLIGRRLVVTMPAASL
jgi:hypothetical protein